MIAGDCENPDDQTTQNLPSQNPQAAKFASPLGQSFRHPLAKCLGAP
jgi:hypothetical protein